MCGSRTSSSPAGVSTCSFLALDAVVEKSFELRRVRRLPRECDTWSPSARVLLLSTVVAQDIDIGDIDDIVGFDDGDWGDDSFVRYCAGECGCGSGGDMQKACQRTKELVRKSLG